MRIQTLIDLILRKDFLSCGTNQGKVYIPDLIDILLKGGI
jgi:hypothetical protein